MLPSKKDNINESVRVLSPEQEANSDQDSDPTTPLGVLSTVDSLESVDSLQHTEETPIGRHIGSFGVVMMIVQRIIGSGIFAVSGSIYQNVGGSPFLFFFVWACAGYMSFAGVFCFLELGSLVPRSGGMKVFLQYIYYRCRMMVTVVFGLYSIMFGFTISNAIIFGEYTLYALGFDNVEKETAKHVGLLFVVSMCVLNGISPHWGVKAQNVVGAIKLGLLFLMAFSGIWVLLFPSSMTHVENQLHWSDFFVVKREITVGSLGSALLKAIFSFDGWQTAQIVTNEIKDPVRTMNFAAPLALALINVCYFCINLSYLAVIPDKDLSKLQEMVGNILMERIFGPIIGRRLLTLIVAISAAGNIMTVLYHISRMNQDVFREGFLPFSHFFASNKPFGSPMRCLVFPLVISAVFLLVPTPSNVYNWVVNLEGYPSQLFVGLTCFGIILLRRRNQGKQPEFKARLIHIIFVTAFDAFVCISALNPRSMSKEYAGFPNYAYVALSILFGSFLYWLVLFKILPRLGHYKLEKYTIELSDGLTMKKWAKIRNAGMASADV